MSILIHAFRQCGMKAMSEPAKAHVIDVVVERHPVIVAVRGVSADERMDKAGWKNAVVQAMLRVDLAACGRLGLETGRELDRWLGRHELAVEALVVPRDGYDPPFLGHRLAFQRCSSKEDAAWVAHMVTAAGGRYRDARWLVEKPS